ncbi:large ribosomal subunit protein mL54-like [Glandiceps talaboti]
MATVLKFSHMFRSLSHIYRKPTVLATTTVARYAKKPGMKGKAPMIKKEVGPMVIGDPDVLVARCVGANIYKEGPDPELKADTEYPDWLWTLNTGPPESYKELSPDTRHYWSRLRKLQIWRKNALKKIKPF